MPVSASNCRLSPTTPSRRARRLTCRSDSSPVTYKRRRGAAQGIAGLQQHRGFADARIAAEQRDRAEHQAATQHAIQLFQAGRDSRVVGVGHLRQTLRCTARQPSAIYAPCCCLVTVIAFKRVAGAAGRAQVPATAGFRCHIAHRQRLAGASPFRQTDPGPWPSSRSNGARDFGEPVHTWPPVVHGSLTIADCSTRRSTPCQGVTAPAI